MVLWEEVSGLLVFVTVKKRLRELKGRKDFFFFFGHGFLEVSAYGCLELLFWTKARQKYHGCQSVQQRLLSPPGGQDAEKTVPVLAGFLFLFVLSV